MRLEVKDDQVQLITIALLLERYQGQQKSMNAIVVGPENKEHAVQRNIQSSLIYTLSTTQLLRAGGAYCVLCMYCLELTEHGWEG